MSYYKDGYSPAPKYNDPSYDGEDEDAYSKTRPTYSYVGELVRETERAVLFRFIHPVSEILAEEWFPLSQVEEMHHTPDNAPGFKRGESCTIVISAWIASKKGLV